MPAHRPPLRASIAALGAVCVAACGGSDVRALRPEYDLRSPDPELRTRAVAQVATTRDATHASTLVFLLDDDDAAVRASAAVALEDLTGRRSGYRPYMESLERRRWQEDWRAFLSGRSAPGGSVPGTLVVPAPFDVPPPDAVPAAPPVGPAPPMPVPTPMPAPGAVPPGEPCPPPPPPVPEPPPPDPRGPKGGRPHGGA